MYRRVISVYDGHNLEEKDGQVYIDGIEARVTLSIKITIG